MLEIAIKGNFFSRFQTWQKPNISLCSKTTRSIYKCDTSKWSVKYTWLTDTQLSFPTSKKKIQKKFFNWKYFFIMDFAFVCVQRKIYWHLSLSLTYIKQKQLSFNAGFWNFSYDLHKYFNVVKRNLPLEFILFNKVVHKKINPHFRSNFIIKVT